MSQALKKFPLIGLIIFIAVTVLSGFVAGYLADYLGASGVVATSITLSIMFIMWIYITRTPMSMVLYVFFLLMGLGVAAIATAVSDVLAITDAILQTLMFSGLFFIVLVFLGSRKQQLKPPRK